MELNLKSDEEKAKTNCSYSGCIGYRQVVILEKPNSKVKDVNSIPAA
jgi:hypothetical protein